MSYDVTLFLQLILLPTTKTHNNGVKHDNTRNYTRYEIKKRIKFHYFIF